MLWLIRAGAWLAIGYVVSGLILCITIIGIPFGVQAFKLSVLALWPFGHSVENGSSGAFAVPSDPTGA